MSYLTFVYSFQLLLSFVQTSQNITNLFVKTTPEIGGRKYGGQLSRKGIFGMSEETKEDLLGERKDKE